MIKELVIHLGDRKTGSTSIQMALVSGGYKTDKATIVYPSTKNHRGLAKTLSDKPHFDQRAAHFSRLYETFLQSDADLGIISAERFEVVDPQVLLQSIETY